MARRRSDGASEGTVKRLQESSGDVLQIVVDYVKQETIEPIRGLGRFVAFGLTGSILIGSGLVLLLVAMLRLLQTETGTALTGNLSWVPYGAVVIVALVLIGLFTWRISRGPAVRRRPENKEENG